MPIDGHEADVDRLKTETSQLAGVAQRGIAAAGAMVAVSTPPGGVSLNPVAAWLTITQPKPLLYKDDVLNACLMAESRLLILATEAAEAERSFAGRVAALIRWPGRVRDLAGFPANSRAGMATQWSVGAVVFALITGVLASLLWTLIQVAIKVGE